ncbi:SDR family NAD(P)-dependent oxidoreductase [bacterium]|nr:SDR family NAD(P)-dependent oxidoreductase [bacterium]MCI0602171.1 SDR family NAD(P)-dependent oxidoreductase [bacterium]
MRRLKDKVAVITGGSKGIGKATAEALAREGCHVVLAARHEEELKKTAREISRLNVTVLTFKADVRKWKEVESLAARVQEKMGTPQILINNAGIGRFGEVTSMNEEDFRATLETNLFGVFYCSKAFLPGMIQNQEGHIVNISSLAGKNSFPGGSAYCASKHGLIAFAECLMLEVRHHNIKVSTICPGTVQTEFSSQTKDKSWAVTAEDVGQAVIDVLTTSAGSLISMVDLRPLHPPKR